MRVSQSGSNAVQTNDVNNTRKTGKASEAQDGKSSRKTETALRLDTSQDVKTEVSNKARDMARAKAVADSAPDVREEKIAELKRRIAAGKYHVDANAIADRMVDEHLSTAEMS